MPGDHLHTRHLDGPIPLCLGPPNSFSENDVFFCVVSIQPYSTHTSYTSYMVVPNAPTFQTFPIKHSGPARVLAQGISRRTESESPSVATRLRAKDAFATAVLCVWFWGERPEVPSEVASMYRTRLSRVPNYGIVCRVIQPRTVRTRY